MTRPDSADDPAYAPPPARVRLPRLPADGSDAPGASGDPTTGQTAPRLVPGPVPDPAAGVPAVQEVAGAAARGGARPAPPAARAWTAAAWAAPDDVPRIAAALGPAALVVPCPTLDALAAHVRGGVEAAVVGSTVLSESDGAGLSALVARHPTTVFAGLDTPAARPDRGVGVRAASEATSRLRRTGVYALFHTAGAAGWRALNRSLAAARLPDPVQRACVAAVLTDLWGGHRTHAGGPAEAGLGAFFALAFDPEVGAVGDAAAWLGESAVALEARFARHGLSEAGRYVAAARLVRAAWTGDAPAPGALAAAVRRAGRTAPPDVRRAVRRLRRLATDAIAGRDAVPDGESGSALRGTSLRGTSLLARYRATLVLPFRDALVAAATAASPPPDDRPTPDGRADATG